MYCVLVYQALRNFWWSLQCIVVIETIVVFVRKTRMGTLVFSLSSLDLSFLRWEIIALVG